MYPCAHYPAVVPVTQKSPVLIKTLEALHAPLLSPPTPPRPYHHHPPPEVHSSLAPASRGLFPGVPLLSSAHAEFSLAFPGALSTISAYHQPLPVPFSHFSSFL